MRTDEYLRFRSLLVNLRKQAGLTQAELAARLAKPQSFVSKIERGERRVDVVELETVANALGTDPIRVMRNLSARPINPLIDFPFLSLPFAILPRHPLRH